MSSFVQKIRIRMFVFVAFLCTVQRLNAQIFSANFNTNAAGWSFSTAQGGNDWKWYIDQGVGASGGIRNKNVSTSNWAISPAVSLTGGVTYRISADARAQTANSRTFSFAYNTVASITGTTAIGTTGNLPLTFTNYQYTFTPATSGTYYLVFSGTQVGASVWAMEYFDNVLLEMVNLPPTCTLTSPSNNSAFTEGDPITLTANASDSDGNISSVQFFDGSTSLGSDNTSPYSITWNGAAVGSHNLTARATDNLGAQTTSAPVSMSVNANTPPSVSITQPSTNASFSRGSLVTVTANASDAEGSVSKVEFFINGTKTGEDLDSPYSFQWTATGLGNQTITLVATDNAGASNTSSGVVISVTNVNPVVALPVPSNGSVFVSGEYITFTANASDADGVVAKVEFFANGSKIGEDISSPYSFVWTNAGQASHSVYAVATDGDGGTSTTATNTITVDPYAPQTLLNWNFAANATGWVFSTAAGGNDWKWYATTGVGGTGGLRNKFSSTNNANWAIAPAVTLNAGSTYAFSVDSRIDQGTGNRQLEMLYNTTPSLTGATSFFSATLPTNSYAQPPYLTYTGKFTPPTSGTYYLILRSLGAGYVFMYFDNVLLEKNFSPVISISAPLNNSTVLEYNNIGLSVNASDPDGSITKVEYFANGTSIGSSTTSPFSLTWSQPLPASYSLFAVATDNRANQTTSPTLQTTVNFTDGTLSDYVDYRFTGSLGDWTFVNTGTDNQAIRYRASGGWNNSSCLQLFNVNTTSFASSPALFLTSGINYKLELRCDIAGSGRNVVIQRNSTPALGGTNVLSFTPPVTEDFLTLRNTTFTVPSSGIYYFTIYVANGGGYQQLNIDNFRIVGELNQCPISKMTYPSSALTTAEGASVTLMASAVDYDGSVAKVEFYDNGVKLGEDVGSPYQFVWNNVSPGSHPIRVVAVDNEGVSLGSPVVNVTVANPGFTASSFLGGTGSLDDVRGTVIQKNGTVVMAANISNATPGGLSPTLLNGASATTSGAIIRMNASGTQVLSVTRLADKVVDLSEDSSDNLYVAAAGQGLFKLNAAASQVIWSKTYTANCHRVDAGPAGFCVALTAATSNYDDHNALTGVGIWVYDPSGNQTANYGGLLQYTPDVCIDEASQTVISIGFKNIVSNTSDAGNQPVVIPYIQGRDFSGVVKYSAYNWDGDSLSPNYINRPTSNMADTRASKAAIGKDGKLYVGYEVAGGNHPIRYAPFNIMTPVTIVGGDNFSTFSNTGSEHKLVVGRYEPGTGNFLLGQQFCGRTSTGLGNSVFVGEGNLDADQDGRVYVTGASSSGIPLTIDHLPGQYSGGAFVLVLSPDMAVREQVVRVSTQESHAIAVRNRNHFAVGGSCGSNSVLFSKDPIQAAPANSTDNGWFAVYYQNGGNARFAFSEPEKQLDAVVSGTMQFSLLPNPVSGQDVQIQFQTTETAMHSNIQLFDAKGLLLGKFASKSALVDLPTRTLKPGLYFIRIEANGTTKTGRILVE